MHTFYQLGTKVVTRREDPVSFCLIVILEITPRFSVSDPDPLQETWIRVAKKKM